MTPAMVNLLKLLIEADRYYHSKRARNHLASLDDRGVEISPVITGVQWRTALKLEELGLAEIVSIRSGKSHVFLGSYQPFDEE